jgi:hypothetical protein
MPVISGRVKTLNQPKDQAGGCQRQPDFGKKPPKFKELGDPSFGYF